MNESENWWHPATLRCYCHDMDCCPAYESWCEEQQEQEWWASLTEEERQTLKMSICHECYQGFDDNPGKQICKTCEDWMVTYYDDDGVIF